MGERVFIGEGLVEMGPESDVVDCLREESLDLVSGAIVNLEDGFGVGCDVDFDSESFHRIASFWCFGRWRKLHRILILWVRLVHPRRDA